ncbi:MAG: sigma-70 family RNA polymerase sigma factor [Acidimicrobiales bacterium]|nr:sigma-70 family RNA polymerase sigma factor [Acidimicrobiales bacterium]HRW36191.1 sigma-70 family RNA polymerase sigma factor [Aquihabitans sp.]
MADFARLVETESRGLLAAVTAIVGDAHRAEEIVQDAFERAYRRWRRVSRLDRPGAWVRRVAINEAISQTRRRTSERKATVRLEALAGVDPTPVDPLQALEDEAVWAAVRALPREQAVVIALRYGADLGIDEIAETVGSTAPAVKSLLHRARAALRESAALEPYA